MIGKSVFNFIHPDDLENSREVLQSLRDERKIINFENRLLTKSGDEVWIMWLIIPLGDSEIILAFDRDITIQKDLSLEFILQQQKYKSIFDNLPMGIAITDSKGKIIETNKNCSYVF